MFLSEVSRSFSFSLFLFVLLTGCDNLLESPVESGFTFNVIDAGQGLAQIGMHGDSAVLWDMGPGSDYDSWITDYERMGKPRVVAIVISHTHEDHYGGLAYLGKDFNWNGRLITSPHEDTAFLRNRAGQWKERIHFVFASKNDTLNLFDSVGIRCLWPPEAVEIPEQESEIDLNRYSMVFSIEYGNTNVLITSDIDSVSQKSLVTEYNYKLCSDILVAPHHGSVSSTEQLFFGYVVPSITIISCGRDNSYGHPSRIMIEELLNIGSDILFTYIDGSVVFRSNGYYWERIEIGF